MQLSCTLAGASCLVPNNQGVTLALLTSAIICPENQISSVCFASSWWSRFTSVMHVQDVGLQYSHASALRGIHALKRL